ncbi:hypothetical protein AK812_SmicGene8412 [Symbiodinium microadriaticum]|uniref:Uncharacterized protein n=1 Tax=Symbiodinium microadriaticum TaxID=2951 RepID=A0A1Q9EKZ6_SYMMI|nr:hypothetical protein AK812_SmicGene8412 [Symbiodinium microadriaticum]
MFETGAVTLLDNAEARNDELLDEHLNVTLDTGDVDAEQTAARVLFSGKLRCLISELVKDSAKLIARQNEDSNGIETWKRLFKKLSLPGATRSTSLLTQLLGFKFNPTTFEQVREVILEYHRSRLLMNPVAQTSANATFQGGASARMDIGALAAAMWKGKGKERKEEKESKEEKEKERTFRSHKEKEVSIGTF